ncbi:MAG: 23S rRNA (adenine(2503)-C(2))-methyltransferase RlmN [Phycisphaerales bacterium]
MSGSIHVLGLTSHEFVAAASARGVSRPAALAAYHAAFREGRTTLPWVALPAPRITAIQRDRTEFTGIGPDAVHETVKFALRHDDGLETESVIIPMRRARGVTRTLCVSSQVGCAMGCRFCETAQMGLLRNLSAAEIVGQWHAARHAVEEGLGVPIKNIVFMGMGEPMDNLDAVLQAVRVLADRHGPEIAPSHITVSTVGRIDGIARLAAFIAEPGFHRLNLAVSINAPNDEIRSRIMPINRATPMGPLMDSLRAWPLRSSGAICVEYVLIPGVNDAPEHCDELCAYLRPLRCSLNVIPYNPRRESPWPAPTEQETTRFIERAALNGQFVKRRQTKGRDTFAACGQLGNPRVRRRRMLDEATVTIEGAPR